MQYKLAAVTSVCTGYHHYSEEAVSNPTVVRTDFHALL